MPVNDSRFKIRIFISMSEINLKKSRFQLVANLKDLVLNQEEMTETSLENQLTT